MVYEIANDEWAKKICKGFRLMFPKQTELNDNQILNKLIESKFNELWRDFEWEMRKKIVAACDHEGARRNGSHEICDKCGGHRSLKGPEPEGCGWDWREFGPWGL